MRISSWWFLLLLTSQGSHDRRVGSMQDYAQVSYSYIESACPPWPHCVASKQMARRRCMLKGVGRITRMLDAGISERKRHLERVSLMLGRINRCMYLSDSISWILLPPPWLPWWRWSPWFMSRFWSCVGPWPTSLHMIVSSCLTSNCSERLTGRSPGRSEMISSKLRSMFGKIC